MVVVPFFFLASCSTHSPHLPPSGFPAVGDIDGKVGVYARVGQVGADAGAELDDLVPGPAHEAGEEGHAHGLAAFGKVLLGPEPELFELLVAGPAVDGPAKGDADDVDEAGGAHHVGDAAALVELEARALPGLHHQVRPAAHGAFGPHGAVVAAQREVNVLHLDVAAALQEVVALAQEPWPVSKRPRHHERVDVVELEAEVPVLLEVVDLEQGIWWHAAGLWRRRCIVCVCVCVSLSVFYGSR